MPDVDAYSNSSANAAAGFGAWRGHRVDVSVLWPNRENWSDFTEPNSLYSNWANESYTKVLGIPLFPEGIGDTAAECIEGVYNPDWENFARTMEASGLAAQGTVIRLGWEFNLHSDWGTAEQFAACWRDVVTTVKKLAPGLVWDWNVNRGSTEQMPGNNVLEAYPGNNYVNIIGIDSYDDWPPATSEGGWQQQLNGSYGMDYWLKFAKSHGKMFSVPEWGLSPTASSPGHSGGDDPNYVEHMYDFFRTNSSELAFEAYFNDSGNSLYDPDQDQNSSAEYAKLWSGGTP
jgi:hypothetical protein